jgi:hypothetical protein
MTLGQIFLGARVYPKECRMSAVNLVPFADYEAPEARDVVEANRVANIRRA